MKEKFPLKLVKNNRGSHPFKATTSIEKLVEKSDNTRQALAYVQQDYQLLIEAIRCILNMTFRVKNSDPRLYWLVGDHIIRFLDRIDDIGFYLLEQNQTLARDTGISKVSIEKIVSFRRRFRRLSSIDPSILWSEYRDNKVPIPKKRGRRPKKAAAGKE